MKPTRPVAPPLSRVGSADGRNLPRAEEQQNPARAVATERLNKTPKMNLHQTAKPKALDTGFVCAQAFSTNEQVAFEDPRAVPNHTRPQDGFLGTLRKHAQARGCTPQDLLVMRLAEMQHRIVCALGEVSIVQFVNPGPEGYVTMRLSETGFDISVEFRPVFPRSAIYHEALITPGSLQQRRAQLAAQILERGSQQGVSVGNDAVEDQLIEQLKNGESHWDGRKKADLALKILLSERIASRALSFVEKDQELSWRTFAESPLKLQQITQQLLLRRGLPEANHD